MWNILGHGPSGRIQGGHTAYFGESRGDSALRAESRGGTPGGARPFGPNLGGAYPPWSPLQGGENETLLYGTGMYHHIIYTFWNF